MSKNKNKKRNIAKRKQRAGSDKRQKRKLKLVKLKAAERQGMAYERPPISGMEPPDGFRSISSSQAMMEYARPIMEKTESDADIEGSMQVAMVFWNYSLILKRKEKNPELANMEKKIRTALMDDFQMDVDSAREFIDMMVARHNHLFPEDIQPKGAPFMFIRKEVKYLIRPVEDARIELNPTQVAMESEEGDLLAMLRQLDEMTDGETEWDDVEELLSSVKIPVSGHFRDWLVAKGMADEPADAFSDCIFLWLDFIYAYGHDEDTSLADVPESSWQEFFFDFLLRKMMVDPPLYVNWPPALKLFYRYLHDRGYINETDYTEQVISEIEPDFYNMLRQQFS